MQKTEGSQKKEESKKVKTTIDIPEDMWRQFSIKVIEDRGGRKKNDVIQELINKYLNGEVKLEY